MSVSLAQKVEVGREGTLQKKNSALSSKFKGIDKKWKWQTFTLICLRVKWYDEGDRWNEKIQSEEEDSETDKRFRRHSGG